MHAPVLLNEMLNILKPTDGETYADCTFGAGGYSAAIMAKADVTVYAVDMDPSVKIYADELKGKLYFMQGNFGDLPELLAERGVSAVDAIIADLGVSSMQIDQADRGFSFQKTGPLDMRMSFEGTSAYELVNNRSQNELSNIIRAYGEESKAKAIARAICQARVMAPIESTTQLADIVRSVFKGKRGKIDSATKTFQAIRIWVNKELENLQRLLECSERLLNEGGRLIVISFHSLEDGLVKKFLQKVGRVKPAASRYALALEEKNALAFKIITKKPITPSKQELSINIRARSAKLRAAIRINKQEVKV